MTPQQEFTRVIILVVAIAIFVAFVSGYWVGK